MENLNAKLVYSLGGKATELPIRLKILSRALINEARPLLEALDATPENSRVFKEEFVALLKQNPELIDIAAIFDKPAEEITATVKTLDANQRALIGDVMALHREATYNMRQRVGYDAESVDAAFAIFRIVVDITGYDPAVQKLWEGELTEDFWQSVEAEGVLATVLYFRQKVKL